MSASKPELWQRFQKYYTDYPTLGLSLDLSRMNFGDDYFDSMKVPIQKAFIAMAELEKGGIANPDEKRMVGHYWLRNPALAPTPTIAKEISDTLAGIKAFAAEVHSGKVQGAKGPFKNLLVVGIGGSALGPQFVSNALTQPGKDKLQIYFFDNTDPDGMPGRHGYGAGGAWERVGADALLCYLEVGRHERDAEWNAGGGSSLYQGGPEIRAACGGGDGGAE
jgi:hypothetical protein